MADDKKKTGWADNQRINVNEPYEVTYWTNELGCTKKELVAAVQEAGVSVQAVKKQLGK